MSKRWLKERKQDYYYRLAKKTGMRSRATFKLQQIDERYKIFRKGMIVLDLGASPGGWSQYAASAVGKNGKVIAVDIAPMEPIQGVIFIQGDIREKEVISRVKEEIYLIRRGRKSDVAMRKDEELKEREEERAEEEVNIIEEIEEIQDILENENKDNDLPTGIEEIQEKQETAAVPETAYKVDAVISDMSPNISGAYSIDHARSVELCETALWLAGELLKQGGSFVCKIFQGEEFPQFLQKVKKQFSFVKAYSPKASRSSSSETYIVGVDYLLSGKC